MAATATRTGLRRFADPVEMVWAALPWLLPALGALMSKMATVDLAYQLRAGNEILDSSSIPRADSYTFSAPGAEWVDQQWGGQALLALVHRAGSWAALTVTQAALLSIAFGTLYLACRLSGASPRAASLLTLGGLVVSLPSLAMRPQLFAIPLFTITLWILAGRLQHPRRLWAIPIIAALCANVHGAFVLLPLLVGLAWLQDVNTTAIGGRRLAVLTAATAVATLANPFGLIAWTNAFDVSNRDVIRHGVTEWKPTSLDSLPGWLMIGSAVALAVLLARRAGPTPWPVLLRLVIFFTLAMMANRAALWWALVVVVDVAGLIGESTRSRPQREVHARQPVAPAAGILAFLAIAVVLLLPWWGRTSIADRLTRAPIELSDAVARELPAGSRLFVQQQWGSWFEFARPEMLVFVDTRFEVLPERLWEDYQEVLAPKPGWSRVLDSWRVDAVVVPVGWGVVPLLRADSAWRVAYENEEGVVFVRR